MGREASSAFRAVLGVCSLGWRGCYQGCNQGCRGCYQGCNRGCNQVCNLGCRGCNQECRGCNWDATRDAQGMQPGMLYASFASKQGCAHLNIGMRHLNNSSVGIPCAFSVHGSFIMLAHSHFGLFCILSASFLHPWWLHPLCMLFACLAFWLGLIKSFGFQ